MSVLTNCKKGVFDIYLSYDFEPMGFERVRDGGDMPIDKKPKTRTIFSIIQRGRPESGVGSLLIESPMTGKQLEGFVALLCYRLQLDPEVALNLVVEDEVEMSKSRSIPWLTIGVRKKTFRRMMQIFDPEYRKALESLGLA